KSRDARDLIFNSPSVGTFIVSFQRPHRVGTVNCEVLLIRKTSPLPDQKVKMATVRNLKIKTSTCKRVVKELHSYEKEVEREAAKTADMKEKGADPYDLKQQENVLAESRMMIPDCRKRLESALAELKAALTELEEENQEGQEIEDARSTIADVEKLFQTTEA
ncbi:hypothetical protein CISIN_1g038806mg, partial [Citrus sinensis]